MSFVVRSIITVAAVLCAALTATGAASAPPQSAPRIVAIGDVHGALDSLTAILQAAGLIDAQRKWTGGRTRLVQTGDFLDRGADVRPVMELLMRLEDEARRAGGRVEILFGNHEGMNVLRDVRDVSADALLSFADRNSESKRSRAFITHATIARRGGQELNRNEWLRDHPPGFVEYLQAMGPSGRFGRWIRARKVVTKVDDSIFMHAGIPLESTATLDDINRTVEREIRAMDDAIASLEGAALIGPASTLQDVVNAAVAALNDVAAVLRDKKELPPHVTQEFVTRLQGLLSINQWALTAPEGPLWYRGYATVGENAQPQFDALLKRLGARRFVVGHTPQLPGRITARLGNGVFLIDTGMLATYYKGGRPAALEITGGRVTAVYTDQREPLVH
jgi:hypothetical protein